MSNVNLEQARILVRETLAKGVEQGFKPLTAVVLDAGGNVVAAEKSDGASPGRFLIAQGKAYGAVMLGMPGSAQMARAEAQAYFMDAANGVFGGKTVPVPGGILLRAEAGGPVIGALGVTGDTSDNDAIAGSAAAAAAGLVGDV